MMKKALILSAIIALTTATSVYAGEVKNTEHGKPFGPCKKNPDFRPDNNHRPDMRVMEFEKRLNLTEAQKEKIKQNREADRAKMKPIMDQLQQKRAQKAEIIKKYEESNPDLVKINKEIKDLHEQQRKIMEANRKSFESILTKEQKAELEKMKKEREAFKKDHKPGKAGKPNKK